MLEIQVVAWDRHKKVAVLNLLTWSPKRGVWRISFKNQKWRVI